MKVWYNWPSGYISGYLPWYKILWRLTFAPLLLLGVSSIYAFYFLTQGYQTANEEIKSVVQW
jgi:hypothetical protein